MYSSTGCMSETEGATQASSTHWSPLAVILNCKGLFGISKGGGEGGKWKERGRQEGGYFKGEREGRGERREGDEMESDIYMHEEGKGGKEKGRKREGIRNGRERASRSHGLTDNSEPECSVV